ncbi:MAG: AAA family ATPase [Candidatus Altiarchaeales archaeon WOR_SM1_79]|nr:MAG: AAA family ATPase [Candidatus Altiarchaeales archaeon WOR_SM1_79]
MIRDVLLIQKREIERRLKEEYVERDIDLKKFDNDLIKVIIGPRRAGKSFFAIHVLDKLGSFGYANFDDEKLVEVEDYDEIVSTINSLCNNPEYLLFDEIQNLDKWELFVNRLQRQGYNIVTTGSNSKLLGRELATHLTGRHLQVNIFPFSFKEFLKLEKKELTENEVKTRLFTYLTYGGYPEPLVKKLDYRDYLSTLFNSTIYKDIVKRFKVRYPQAIEDLAVYLISNIAREFSYNTLTKVTKCRSIHTVEKYLNYLEEAFILFKINRFSFKVKEQISSNKKIYCIDNGFVYAKAFRFSSDIGRLYENTVAIELKKLEMNGVADIYFWKNPQQEEVDFVVKKGLNVDQLIQVCYDINDVKTREREIRALLKASKELKCKNLLVITGDYEAEEQSSWFGIKREVKFTPLWKWLMER